VARPVAGTSELDREARFSLSALTGALGGVYVAAGITLFGGLFGMAAFLVGVGICQAIWGTAAHRGSRRALVVGALGNALLVAAWVASRTVGLSPGGGGRLPVGILDALCAADSLVIVVLATSSLLRARRVRAGSRRPAISSQLAILLGVLTVSALLGGHTHTAQAQGPAWSSGPSHLHLYCRLL
jgi:hypothetical protein